jgi:hypothetical protein
MKNDNIFSKINASSIYRYSHINKDVFPRVPSKSNAAILFES